MKRILMGIIFSLLMTLISGTSVGFPSKNVKVNVGVQFDNYDDVAQNLQSYGNEIVVIGQRVGEEGANSRQTIPLRTEQLKSSNEEALAFPLEGITGDSYLIEAKLPLGGAVVCEMIQKVNIPYQAHQLQVRFDLAQCKIPCK